MLRKLFKNFSPKKDESFEKIKLPEINFRNLFESMDVGFAYCQMIYDNAGKPQDFRYLYVNPAFSTQTGLSLQRVLGHTVREIIPKIEEFWIETYARVVESGKSERFENKVASIGKTFEINVWRCGAGCFAVVFEDITDPKKSDEESKSKTKELERLSKLQEDTRKALLNVMEDLEKTKTSIETEKAKDEAMLASIGEGLIAVDNERKILVMNRAAENILGYKEKEVLGRKITSLPLADKDGNILPLNKRPTFKAISANKQISNNYFFIKRDKTRIPLAINVTPIKLGGKIIGALDVFRDITRETEIDRAKSEFVSLASHQLRTPLGIMKWYLEALENENYFKKSPRVVRDYYEQIHKSNDRVLSLVGDLLSVSRIDQGRVKNAPKSVDPAQLVKEVVEQMQIVARKKRLIFH